MYFRAHEQNAMIEMKWKNHCGQDNLSSQPDPLVRSKCTPWSVALFENGFKFISRETLVIITSCENSEATTSSLSISLPEFYWNTYLLL